MSVDGVLACGKRKRKRKRKRERKRERKRKRKRKREGQDAWSLLHSVGLDGKSFYVDFMTLIADGDARAILISIAIHSCYQIRLRSKAVEQCWTCDEVQPCKYNSARFQHLKDTLHRCCTLPLLCPIKV